MFKIYNFKVVLIPPLCFKTILARSYQNKGMCFWCVSYVLQCCLHKVSVGPSAAALCKSENWMVSQAGPWPQVRVSPCFISSSRLSPQSQCEGEVPGKQVRAEQPWMEGKACSLHLILNTF